MCVCNGETFLGEAVESILNQTFADFEFIIIDDGSTDKTPEILSGYARGDRRVRVFAQQNTGRSEALNRGIELANADLIARMDADDVSLPQRLGEQYEFVRRHSEVGLLGGDIQLITPDSRNLGPWFAIAHGDVEIRRELARSCQFIHPTVMMRKSVVLAAGGFRRAFSKAEDYDLFLRMAEHTQMANLEQTVLLYRIHGGQASTREIARAAQCCLAARAAAAARGRGLPDPLIGVAEVNPEVLQSIGITIEQMRQEEIELFRCRMAFLPAADPESALQMIAKFVDTCASMPGQEDAAADALLLAARMCYRRRQFARALALAARAAAKRPATAGQCIRMAVARRARQLRAAQRAGS